MGKSFGLICYHKNHISFYINRSENHTNRFEKVSQIVLRLVVFTLTLKNF